MRPLCKGASLSQIALMATQHKLITIVVMMTYAYESKGE